jgi:hypothetical protein
MRNKILIFGIFSVAVLLVYVHFFKQSVSWHAKTKQTMGVFSSEFEPSNEVSFNQPTGKPIARLAKDESIDVLTDTYGKDYWACYVRTSKGVKGWVLCTSLKKIN